MKRTPSPLLMSAAASLSRAANSVVGYCTVVSRNRAESTWRTASAVAVARLDQGVAVELPTRRKKFSKPAFVRPGTVGNRVFESLPTASAGRVPFRLVRVDDETDTLCSAEACMSSSLARAIQPERESAVLP